MASFRQTWLWPFLVLSVPAIGWFIYALASGYALEGDNAQISIRTFDVFSNHPPLLGMPSTAGTEVAGVNAFHLGPIHFFLLAPLFALSGFASWGLLTSALFINLSLVAIGLWAAWKIGNAWAQRSVVLAFAIVMIPLQFFAFSPWNPFPVVIGGVTLTVLVWAHLAGVEKVLPPAVLVASLVAQSHLVGAVLVASTFLAYLVIVMKYPRNRRPTIAESVVAFVILLICWLPPAWEAIANWPGNLGQLFNYVFEYQSSHSTPDGGIQVSGAGAIIVIAALWIFSGLGMRRAIRALKPRRGHELSSEVQIMATGLLLASCVNLSAAVLGTFADASRVGYLAVYFGAVALQCVLWRPSDFAWWTSPVRSLFAVLIVFGSGLALFGAWGTGKINESAQAAEVLVVARDVLSSNVDDAVVVHERGPRVGASIGIAVVADLITDNRTVYYQHFGDREDYDFWRRKDQAPSEHLELHLIEPNDAGEWPVVESGTLLDSSELTLSYSDTPLRLVLTKRH